MRPFWQDERGGEKRNTNVLLILALIVLPLVVLLIAFSNDLRDLLEETWARVTESSVDTP